MTDSIYRFFMQRVAEGRGLSAEATRAVAKGRVWSGKLLRSGDL
jgi:ClpP class serine protease